MSPPIAPLSSLPTSPSPLLLASATPLPPGELAAFPSPIAPSLPKVIAEPKLGLPPTPSPPYPLDLQRLQLSLDTFNSTMANLAQADLPAPLATPPQSVDAEESASKPLKQWVVGADAGEEETPEPMPPKGKKGKAQAEVSHFGLKHSNPEAEELAQKIAERFETGLAFYLSQDPSRIDDVQALADKLTPDMVDPNQLAQKMHRWFKRHKLVRLAELATRLPVSVLLHVLPPASTDPDTPSPLINRQRVKAWRDAIVSGKSL